MPNGDITTSSAPDIEALSPQEHRVPHVEQRQAGRDDVLALAGFTKHQPFVRLFHQLAMKVEHAVLEWRARRRDTTVVPDCGPSPSE